MRTLGTQVRLRRLDRAFAEALDRLLSEPAEREMAGLISAKLLELAGDVRDAWKRESVQAGRPRPWTPTSRRRCGPPSSRSRRCLRRAPTWSCSGRDFEGAVLPLEVFLRGLDAEPALQRSA